MKGEWDVPTPNGCTACGAHHGSVAGELNCLRTAVVRLRGELAGARHVCDTLLAALGPGRKPGS